MLAAIRQNHYLARAHAMADSGIPVRFAETINMRGVTSLARSFDASSIRRYIVILLFRRYQRASWSWPALSLWTATPKGNRPPETGRPSLSSGAQLASPLEYPQMFTGTAQMTRYVARATCRIACTNTCSAQTRSGQTGCGVRCGPEICDRIAVRYSLILVELFARTWS